MNELEKILTQSATLGFFGRSPIMPGTVGALLGTIFSYILFFLFRRPVVWGLVLLLILFTIISCGVAERVLNTRDPRSVILDEFVAMPVCFIFLPFGSIWIFVLGFLIFRVFDIIKPFGLKRLERLPGGLGIVADDLGAAGYTSVVLCLVNFVFNISC